MMTFFKKNAQDVFYPLGAFGKGRILLNAPTAARIRRSETGFNFALMTWLTLAATSGTFYYLQPGYVVGGVVALLIARFIYVQALVRGMPYTARPTFAEVQRSEARSQSLIALVLLLIMCGLLVYNGLILVMRNDKWLGIGSAVFFGMYFASFVWMNLH